MKIQPAEKQFSKWFRENFNGWCERIEPSPGMNPGIPDLVLMTDLGICWAELKIASIIDGVLWSNPIRASQISWHINYHQKNRGRQPLSVFVFGVWSATTWKVFAASGSACMAWENGIKTLYYQRSTNPSQEYSRELLNCSACEG